MQLRHISPRSIDWMDAMDEGSGGRGWEKLGPEERVKLRQDVQVAGPAAADGQLATGAEAEAEQGRRGPRRAQGFEPRSPSR
jgi:hypothetical protein